MADGRYFLNFLGAHAALFCSFLVFNQYSCLVDTTISHYTQRLGSARKEQESRLIAILISRNPYSYQEELPPTLRVLMDAFGGSDEESLELRKLLAEVVGSHLVLDESRLTSLRRKTQTTSRYGRS
jgi:hypothetical protein